MGPTLVSHCREAIFFSEVSKCIIIATLGHYEVSFMRGCPFLGGSFIGGSTVISTQLIPKGDETRESPLRKSRRREIGEERLVPRVASELGEEPPNLSRTL